MIKLSQINYWFILLLLLGFAACNDDNDDEVLGSKAKLNVSASALRFNSNKADTVFVDYAGSWNAKLSDDSWCTLDNTSGKGKGMIIITPKPRNDMEMKSAKLIVQATDRFSEMQIINLLFNGTEFYADPIVVEFGLGDPATYAVDVVYDGAWTATLEDESWCRLEQASGNGNGQIKITSTFGPEDAGEKSTVLTLTSTENPNLKTTVEIKKVEEFKHGSCITLNKATKGKGINLLITGDGFTKSEMKKNGRWQDILRQCEEAIFSYEPFASYREYFNLYAVTAVSATNTFDLTGGYSNTFFECYFENQTVHEKPGGVGACNFAWEHSPIPADVEGKDLTVLLVINIDRYCGVAQVSGSGPSLGLGGVWTGEGRFPGINTFATMISHEFLGHAFGKLADEYYADRVSITDIEVTTAKREREQFGHWQNVEFTNNPAEFDNKYWKALLEKNYPGAGIIQGGRYCQYGVWRSIDDNIMRNQNNARFFGAVNREIILRRIYKLAGMEDEYSLDVFLEYDKKNITK
ncbi:MULTISPECIES: M64 family metallopeptidase [Butyricimonas]|uniref:M64 family metallopeptidase n=1 Tax=Butyricimonas TaxID=574697 RepID=UPI0007FB1F1C|nr:MULTISPECIES: M64 family metallopeptidase [Butyricimonas]